jgi:putative cell wall-binding protein
MTTRTTLDGRRTRARVVRLGFALMLAGAAVVTLAPRAGAVYGTTNPVRFTRFDGTNRYDTAARIAEAGFTTADTVVMASGLSFADALSGSYLAGFVGGPMLLTDPNAVPQETVAALAALKTKHIDLLGGTSAVSTALQLELASLASTSASGGTLIVTRISGADRYATSAAVDAVPGASNVGVVKGQREALIASGASFPDALAGGALAASSALPIVLTDPGTLSAAASQSLSSLQIKHALILGGDAAVSAAVESAINAGGVTTERVAGANRTQTAQAIASYAALNLGYADPSTCVTPQNAPAVGTVCAFPRIEVARGDDAGGGVDALALGPFAGHVGAPILLSLDQSDPGTPLFLTVQQSAYPGDLFTVPSTLTEVDIAGGAGAVTSGLESVLQSTSGALGFSVETTSAASVAPGSPLTATSKTACPPGPDGNNATGVVTAIENATGNLAQFVLEAVPAGTLWADTVNVSAALAVGSYTVFSYCVVTFPEEPATAYEYGPLYTAVTLTLT